MTRKLPSLEHRRRPWTDEDRRDLARRIAAGQSKAFVSRETQRTLSGVKEMWAVVEREAAEARLAQAKATSSANAERDRLRFGDEKNPIRIQVENAGPGAFEVIETETRIGAERTPKRVYQSPFDKYLGMWREREQALLGDAKAAMRKGRELADRAEAHHRSPERGVSPDQWEAGTRFADDWLAAHGSLGCSTADLHSTGGGRGGAEEAAGAAQVAVRRALDAIARSEAGEPAAKVVIAICGQGESLSDYARRCGAEDKAGETTKLLRAGLDTLVRHYGGGRRRRVA